MAEKLEMGLLKKRLNELRDMDVVDVIKMYQDGKLSPEEAEWFKPTYDNIMKMKEVAPLLKDALKQLSKKIYNLESRTETNEKDIEDLKKTTVKQAELNASIMDVLEKFYVTRMEPDFDSKLNGLGNRLDNRLDEVKKDLEELKKEVDKLKLFKEFKDWLHQHPLIVTIFGGVVTFLLTYFFA